MIGHVRTWEEDEMLDSAQQLVRDIGGMTGTDAEGRILYFYSREEAEKKVYQFLREAVRVWEVLRGDKSTMPGM